jgi:ABC-2 type transport system permease protein
VDVSRVRQTALVVRYAARNGWKEYFTTFTWKTWVIGWYIRVLAQVCFFALIGRMLGSPERTQYLLVGNAILLTTVVSLFAIPSTAWERWAGTLPLLVASPTSPVVVYAGRSLAVVADALLSSLAAFFVAAPLFGIDLPWPRTVLIVPLVALIGLSSYALAIFLGGWVVRKPSMRNVTSNVTHTTIMTVAGVNVPLAFWPAAVAWAAHALPLTHGLQAIRDLLRGEPLVDLLPNVALELLVGLGWLALALLTFDRFAERGRRDGSIEFGG